MKHLYESKARDFKLARRAADTLTQATSTLASCEGAVTSILLLKAETLASVDDLTAPRIPMEVFDVHYSGY